MYIIRIAAVLFFVFLTFLLPACAPNNNPKDNETLASIGKCKITADDLRAEARISLPKDITDGQLAEAKEELLDRIITKKMLVLEAQKQNIDKDKAFIKEIERYWEQALLKLLYKKKSMELAREIKIEKNLPPEQMKDARDKKVEEALTAWIEDLKKRADIKKYNENLKAVQIK